MKKPELSASTAVEIMNNRKLNRLEKLVVAHRIGYAAGAEAAAAEAAAIAEETRPAAAAATAAATAATAVTPPAAATPATAPPPPSPHYTHISQRELNSIYARAIEKYLDIVRVELRRGESRTLVGATCATMTFTQAEQEYFYEAYDALWEGGARIEAYSLMRLVFGVLSKGLIEKLQRRGHLFSYTEVQRWARGA